MSDETAVGSRPVAILIGPPGSGKSTVGPMVAGRLNAGFLDTDDEVASVAGKAVGDIFVEDGEPAFRALERPVAERALRYYGVVALGSGAVLDEQTRRLLAGHRVIYLETGFAEVAKRVGLNKPRVPVPGNPRGMLRAMLEQRRPLYEGLAVVTIPTDGLDPQQVRDKVLLAQTQAAQLWHETHGR
ncbi:MAG TPA: shikimate kinase [Streptosporangiaceae bacterium]|jgi:shikimate kinase